MTSRIQGWSNRQKDTGWGYAFAHLLPFVWIYYSITRRTISVANLVLGSSVLLHIIVVFIAINEFHIPSLFRESPVDENTSTLIFFLDILIRPFVAKYGISEARKDGKKKLQKIREEIKVKENDELKEIKEEVKELKDELEKLKREDK